MYNYFVSFTYRNNRNDIGFGSTIVGMDRKIVDMDALDEIKRDVSAHHNLNESTFAILSFQLIEE